MHFVSPGLRSAARKSSIALAHQGGYNGPGGSTNASSLRRPYHWSPFEAVRPRHSIHKLFSASKNALKQFFAHMTAPGIRPATFLSQSHRSLLTSNNTVYRSTIQSHLSRPARRALLSSALHYKASIFLPGPPSLIPPRCGGIAQVGLGSARNFTTGRPIFQHLVENVPVAMRSLYEIDWDLETRSEYERIRLLAKNSSKKAGKVPRKLGKQFREKPTEVIAKDELENYFPTIPVTPVTTYLLIPLTPTPTLRQPLSLNPPSYGLEPRILPPASFLRSLHVSHATHGIRVSALFSKLDERNVWSNVRCSAYTQVSHHLSCADGEEVDEGVCTILKIEFVGWTKDQVLDVIGDTGMGWCVLEECSQEGFSDEEDKLSQPSSFEDRNEYMDELFNPANSLLLPTLDFSVSPTIPSEIETEPWVDEYSYFSPSATSSYSDLSDLIIEPSSVNGWYESSRGLSPGARFRQRDEREPREEMFY